MNAAQLFLGIVVGVIAVHWVYLNASFQEYRDACTEYQETCSETIAFYENYSAVLYNLTEKLLSENTEIRKNLSEIQVKYNYLKDSYIRLSEENSKLREENENLKSQRGLVNPSYWELWNFLARDDTNELEWSEDFDCTEFSNRLIRNLARKGFFACTVEIDLRNEEEDFGHILVAVNTTDVGLVYVEPQDDTIIPSEKMKIGANYCSLVDWACYYEITKISSCFALLY